MARKTAKELIEMVRNLGVSEDSIVPLLEDITDSVGDVDLSNYVRSDEYTKVVAERDQAVTERNDFRDRYINRFYGNYDSANSTGYVMSQASEADLIHEEKKRTYDTLFE